MDFTDDLALLFHTQQQMQEKTSAVADPSARLENTHRGRSKILEVNAVRDTLITLEGEALGEMESFTYLGSIVDKKAGTDADVRDRIGKTRAAFHQVKSVWGSLDLGTNTKIKIRLFNTIMKPFLLYGAETWRTTFTTMKKIQKFINTCLRRILKIRCPDTSNQEL